MSNKKLLTPAEKEKKFNLELIELYRSLTALWDINTPAYSDRSKKEESYCKLLEKYKQHYPEAGKRELARKLNTLRTNYRRECKRMLTAANNGDSYQTTLYYFDALSFLNDVHAPYSSRNIFHGIGEPANKNIKCDISETDDAYDAFIANESDLDASSFSNDVQAPCTSRSTFQGNEERKNDEKKRDDSATEEFLFVPTDQLKHSEDACQKVANVWGMKLLELQRDQRLLAERIINDIFFQGQLGLLNINTGLTNLTPLSDMNRSISCLSTTNFTNSFNTR